MGGTVAELQEKSTPAGDWVPSSEPPGAMAYTLADGQGIAQPERAIVTKGWRCWRTGFHREHG